MLRGAAETQRSLSLYRTKDIPKDGQTHESNNKGHFNNKGLKKSSFPVNRYESSLVKSRNLPALYVIGSLTS